MGPRTLTYSVVSGADAALFSIDPSTGVLTFVAPPEFDHPLDADGNSVYEVIVQVSNSIATATQAIAVEVTSASESVAEADNTDGHPPWTAYARSSASNSRVNDFDVAGTSPSHSLTGGHSSSDIVRPSSTAGVRFSDGAGASSLGHALPGGDVVRPGITGARFTATAQVTAPTVQTMPSAQVGHLLAIAGTYTVLFGVDGISSHAAHHTDDGRSTDLLIEAGSHDGALAFADTDNLPSKGETDGVAAGKAAPDGAGEAKNPGSTPVAPIIEPAAMQAAVSTESEATLATPLVDPVDGETTTLTPVVEATTSVTEPVTETASTTLTPVAEATTSVTEPVTETTTATLAPVTETTTSVAEPVTETTSAMLAPVTETTTTTVTEPVTETTTSWPNR